MTATRPPKHQITRGEDLVVGIDLHKNRWHLTIRTDAKFLCASSPGDWEALYRVLARYAWHIIWRWPMQPVILDSGCIGHLVNHGIRCLVTPPSLVPQELAGARPASGG